jgi:hypothetical protein
VEVCIRAEPAHQRFLRLRSETTSSQRSEEEEVTEQAQQAVGLLKPEYVVFSTQLT